jgi:hypothetical protein
MFLDNKMYFDRKEKQFLFSCINSNAISVIKSKKTF